jgi:hypothetical protein
MFDNIGEIFDPCGHPIRLTISWLFSIIFDFTRTFISLRNRLSEIFLRKHSSNPICGIELKYFRRSISTTAPSLF